MNSQLTNQMDIKDGVENAQSENSSAATLFHRRGDDTPAGFVCLAQQRTIPRQAFLYGGEKFPRGFRAAVPYARMNVNSWKGMNTAQRIRQLGSRTEG